LVLKYLGGMGLQQFFTGSPYPIPIVVSLHHHISILVTIVNTYGFPSLPIKSPGKPYDFPINPLVNP